MEEEESTILERKGVRYYYFSLSLFFTFEYRSKLITKKKTALPTHGGNKAKAN